MPIFDQVLKEVEDNMVKALEFLTTGLRGIRSGRATPGLIEGVRVDHYGTPTPIKQVANIAVPEPRILVIKPFEAASLKNIETALNKANLGFTIQNDGRMIRITVPPLSEEGRQQLIAKVKEMAEKAKVSIRNIRRDGNRKAEQMEKESQLSEDESKRLQDEIQKLTKAYEDKVGKKFEEKKKEISEI